MARDPPSLIASSELRDLSLEPSDVRSAQITIIHPQLRDLILPLERGHVLYPRGTNIEEQRWTPVEDDEPGPSKGVRHGTTRTFARLSFTPNCLTASGPIMACGGQHGELHITNLPSRTNTTSKLNTRFPSTPHNSPIKPFCLSAVLPTMSINNSMIILPGWPDEWHRRERERKAGFIGRHRSAEDDAGDWSEAKEEESGDEDEAMDIDEEDEEDEGSSVATYPNTVAFRHAARIPSLQGPRSGSQSLEIPTTSRRATSFSNISRPDRPDRSVLSSSMDRTSLPQPQFVTSLPSRSPSILSNSGLRRSSATSSRSETPARRRPKELRKRHQVEEPRLLISNNDQTVKMFSLARATSPNPRRGARRDSDSNPLPGAAAYPYARSPPGSIGGGIPSTSAMRRTVSGAEGGRADSEGSRYIHLPRINPIGPPPPRFGSSLGWDSIGVNEGINRMQFDNADFQREIEAARAQLESERESRRRTREEFERVVGMRVGLGSGQASSSGSGGGNGSRPMLSLGTRDPSGGSQGSGMGMITPDWTRPDVKAAPTEERKLAKIGGARFKYAVNHSSLSPDLKTMVSVGDSSDVYLFEVVDGGREFKRIGTYTAATDAGFSTSWSKDGRKFAVASQDGQVTVWDHRSSKPMAIFHTSSNHRPESPSFTGTDLANARLHVSGSESDSPYQVQNPNVVLIDPVTGASRSGRSTSGKEAARVVKFSPEGSSRDLMVFSEENTNIHIVDARTFHTHVVIPVPSTIPGLSSTTATATPTSNRRGVEGGSHGIAGVAFDPTGEWLYSGTENTVVEWDMRRFGGGGENGTWQMA